MTQNPLTLEQLDSHTRKALGQMLAALGRLPLRSEGEEEALSPEATLALVLLDDVRYHVLSQGWHFNTQEITVTLEEETPEGYRGSVPDNTLAVIKGGPPVRLEEREGEKWLVSVNKVSSSQRVVLALDVAFKDLPTLCAHYVLVKATRRLQDRLMVSPTLHSFGEREEQEAFGLFREWNTQNERPNMLDTMIWR